MPTSKSVMVTFRLPGRRDAQAGRPAFVDTTERLMRLGSLSLRTGPLAHIISA